MDTSDHTPAAKAAAETDLKKTSTGWQRWAFIAFLAIGLFAIITGALFVLGMSRLA